MPGKQSSSERVTDAEFGPRALHVDDAVKLNRRHRLKALLDFNSMQDATLTGVLYEGKLDDEGHGVPLWIQDLQTVNGTPLRLPLAEVVTESRIPLYKLPKGAKIGDRLRLTVNVVLDDSKELTEKGRPFALVAGAVLGAVNK